MQIKEKIKLKYKNYFKFLAIKINLINITNKN